MNSGVYAAFSGMRAQMEALDILSNNLANINTTGFKEGRPFFTVLNNVMNASSGDEALRSNNEVVQAQSGLNILDGSLEATHRDLDVALTGSGFLAVEGPQGVRYTRNGHLSVNAKSVLCAGGGFPVMGESGKPIVLGPGQLIINEEGEIYLNETRVDRLKVVAFDDPAALVREGDSLFVPGNKGVAPKAAEAKIRQGYLEQSNVNAVSCVVGLVGIMRQFEAVQKTVSVLLNDINAKSIERLSR